MRISENALHFTMQSIFILNSPAYRTWCCHELKRLPARNMFRSKEIRSNGKSPNLSRNNSVLSKPECGVQCCKEEWLDSFSEDMSVSIATPIQMLLCGQKKMFTDNQLNCYLARGRLIWKFDFLWIDHGEKSIFKSLRVDLCSLKSENCFIFLARR